MSNHKRVLDLIGNTPTVQLKTFSQGSLAPLYAKLELFNPSGSSKDRVARKIIESMLRENQLETGSTIVVPTTGNLGISLAMLSCEIGVQCICVVTDAASEEKINMMRAYGARVIVTPANIDDDSPASCMSVAKQMSAEITNGHYIENFNNQANLDAHYEATGAEIWAQFSGRISAFVAPIGSSGSLCGVSRYLKEKDPSIEVIGVEPVGSAYANTDMSGVYERFFHTRLEGVGNSKKSRIFDPSLVDEILQISDREAIHVARRLAKLQGVLAGGSSGLALAGTLRYLESITIQPEDPIVILFPDNGTRYLTTIFDDRWMQDSQFAENDWEEETLDDLLGSDIRPALIFAYEDETVGEVVAKLSAAGVSQLPVLARDGKLVGLTTEFRLLDYLLKEKSEGATLHSLSNVDVIEKEIPTLDRSMPIEDVLKLFSNYKTAIIMEDDPFTGESRVEGILTQIDLLDYLAKR